jgi:hypothetical protein
MDQPPPSPPPPPPPSYPRPPITRPLLLAATFETMMFQRGSESCGVWVTFLLQYFSNIMIFTSSSLSSLSWPPSSPSPLPSPSKSFFPDNKRRALVLNDAEACCTEIEATRKYPARNGMRFGLRACDDERLVVFSLMVEWGIHVNTSLL